MVEARAPAQMKRLSEALLLVYIAGMNGIALKYSLVGATTLLVGLSSVHLCSCGPNGGNSDGGSGPAALPPVAYEVQVSGLARMFSTVRGQYSYADPNNDPEGASTFRWFKDGAVIPGQTGPSYSITESDFGSTLAFEVTPVSAIGSPSRGSPVLSAPTPPVGNPLAQIPPSRDVTLIQEPAGDLANGAGRFVYVGRTAQERNQSNRRAIVLFDIAAYVPQGSTILDVTLVVQVTKDAGIAEFTELRVMTANWGEGTSVGFPPDGTSEAFPGEAAGTNATPGDATWLYAYFSSTPWDNVGGDFSDTVSATTYIEGLGTFTYQDPQMIIDVENWLAGTTPNYGYIMIGDESVSETAKQIDGKDSGETSLHLDVEYSLP